MSGYAVAQVDGIDEISDGRCPWRPVGFHFGITSFGVNAFTAHQAGDRLINEHDESQEHDLQEELYLVQRGRATFELDGERVDAPAGTLVFVRPAVKRTAFAEERGTTLVAHRVEVAVLGSKRTEGFVAVNRVPEMLDRVVCPPGEALAAREVVERPRVLRMSFDQLAPLIGSLGVFA